MLESITWEQFSEWHEYAQLEPFGAERDDLRAGIIASTIANANRTKKTRPFKATDFMPHFGPEPDRKREPSRETTDPDAWAAMVSGLKQKVAGKARGAMREIH